MTARPSPRLRQPYSPRHPSPLGFPPLVFQPLPPHMAFVNNPSAYQGPLTPDRHAYPRGPPEARAKVDIWGVGEGGGSGEGGEGAGLGAAGVPCPPEARRPLAGTHSRRRSQPPALNLDNTFHSQILSDPVAKKNEDRNEDTGAERGGKGTELQTVVSPPSPTPSDTSSLSLYSSDSVTKSFPVGVVLVPSSTYLQPNSQGLKLTQPQSMQQGQQEEEDERPPSLFCGCFNFRAWFGGSSSKAKENRILGPPARPIPEPAPQTVQVRRRPTPLNL